MQRKTPLTPQSRRLNRTVARATMAPADFSMTASAVNRRPPLSRQSVMPNVPPAPDATKKLESESKEREIKSLYNKYLQTEMVLILMKRKAAEREKIAASQLAASMKEEDAIRAELSSVKRREKDLQSLIELQNQLDEQIVKVMSSLDVFAKKPKEILTLLDSMLESLDVLKCQNIVIPETKEGTARICELLRNCDSVLVAINEKIGRRRDALISTNKGLKEFHKTYTDIRDCSNKCAEVLKQLQVLVLKESANSLTLVRSFKHPTLME